MPLTGGAQVMCSFLAAGKVGKSSLKYYCTKGNSPRYKDTGYWADNRLQMPTLTLLWLWLWAHSNPEVHLWGGRKADLEFENYREISRKMLLKWVFRLTARVLLLVLPPCFVLYHRSWLLQTTNPILLGEIHLTGGMGRSWKERECMLSLLLFLVWSLGVIFGASNLSNKDSGLVCWAIPGPCTDWLENLSLAVPSPFLHFSWHRWAGIMASLTCVQALEGIVAFCTSSPLGHRLPLLFSRINPLYLKLLTCFLFPDCIFIYVLIWLKTISAYSLVFNSKEF